MWSSRERYDQTYKMRTSFGKEKKKKKTLDPDAWRTGQMIWGNFSHLSVQEQSNMWKWREETSVNEIIALKLNWNSVRDCWPHKFSALALLGLDFRLRPSWLWLITTLPPSPISNDLYTNKQVQMVLVWLKVSDKRWELTNDLWKLDKLNLVAPKVIWS